MAKFFVSTQYFQTATRPTWPGSFSIVAWIFPTAFPQPCAVFAATQSGCVEWRVDTAQTMSLLASQVVNIGTSARKVPKRFWSHVAVTYDGTNWKHYLNGIINGSGSNAQTINSPGAGGYQIGAANPGAEQFNGAIFDVAVWQTILTPGEIYHIATRQKSPLATRRNAFFGYWPMNDQSITQEIDISGQGLHMSIVTGAPTFYPSPVYFTTPLPLYTAAAVISGAVFRKTLSGIGGRVGSRQTQRWAT